MYKAEYDSSTKQLKQASRKKLKKIKVKSYDACTFKEVRRTKYLFLFITNYMFAALYGIFLSRLVILTFLERQNIHVGR